jgi:hypothetical protein
MNAFFWAFLFLNLVDALTTVWLLERSGYELNPIMAAMLCHGSPRFVAMKTTFGLLIGLACLRWSPRLLKLGTVLFASVVSYHLALVWLGLS